MSVRRLSKTFISGAGAAAEKSSSFLAGYSPAIDEMDLIERITVGAGGTSAIEFDEIPQTYQHLQIRMVTTTANSTNSIYYQLNSDTGSNYVSHGLTGDGVTARGRNVTTTAAALAYGYEVGTDSTYPTGIIINILDYASTSKNKTIRSLAGKDSNGSGEVSMWSGLWMSTGAINLFKIYAQTGNLNQYSTASLYGVKA